MMGENPFNISVIGCAFDNEIVPNGAVRIGWISSAGFGQFEIVFDNDGKPHLYTEHMCNKDNKKFAYQIMELLIDNAIVEN